MYTVVKIWCILCLLCGVINGGQSRDDDLDIRKAMMILKERLDQTDAENKILKERLDQKDIEMENLMHQIEMCTTDDKSKRLVMEMDFEQEILNLKKQLGSTYTRWGRTTCPGNGTDLAYSGYMAGTYHTGAGKGSGANYLCLSGNPTWDFYTESVNNQIIITGVEYQFYPHTSDLTNFFGSDIRDSEAPCSVCRTTRNTNMMIPGRKDCYPGWTKEYSGYLVGPYSGYDDGSEYVCLDRRPETVVHSGDSNNDNMLYFIEARCGASLECPPYVSNRELACVVCSI